MSAFSRQSCSPLLCDPFEQLNVPQRPERLLDRLPLRCRDGTRRGSSHQDRLARRLTAVDAVVIGMGSMIGAGIFAALGPAAEAAGTALLLGLAIAAVVACCNATSSAQLAAVYPESYGTYVYGRERLGPFWGFLAGWGFVIGKTASLSAIALTFGEYAWPDFARPLAVAAVVAMTAVNYRGIEKTALVTRIILAIGLSALAVVVVASLSGGGVRSANLGDLSDAGALGILRSAGLLFFAFAGYARIATLGEEVIDPARTISRAIPIALVRGTQTFDSLSSGELVLMDEAPELVVPLNPRATEVTRSRFGPRLRRLSGRDLDEAWRRCSERCRSGGPARGDACRARASSPDTRSAPCGPIARRTRSLAVPGMAS
jgi:APA family basic amino acid/polyamine antiporter